jgi:helix-turn-helix protein/uncharacterized protein DUF6597
MMSEVPTIQRSQPASLAIGSYIDNYVLFAHNAGRTLHKNLLPCPGVSLLFNFSDVSINGKTAPATTVIGLHETVYQLEGCTDRIETLIVQFSPWGCGQLADVQASQITDKILDGVAVFGESLTALYITLKNNQDFAERVHLLDAYFKSRIKGANAGYMSIIMTLAAQLRKTPEPVSFTTINKNTTLPVSIRQMTRRFKDIIGVNLQTYIRICRFHTAKMLLFQEQDLSMTEVGYLSGYYDQAHFAREFKKLSGAKAKNFIPLCVFQKSIPQQQKAS